MAQDGQFSQPQGSVGVTMSHLRTIVFALVWLCLAAGGESHAQSLLDSDPELALAGERAAIVARLDVSENPDEATAIVS